MPSLPAMNASRQLAFAGGAILSFAWIAPKKSATSTAAGSASAERLRSGAYTLVPFCQSRFWKPHVYLPGLTVPIAKPNVSSFVICFAIAISSSLPFGTFGLPSAAIRFAARISFGLR